MCDNLITSLKVKLDFVISSLIKLPASNDVFGLFGVVSLYSPFLCVLFHLCRSFSETSYDYYLNKLSLLSNSGEMYTLKLFVPKLDFR